jgi:hypothetical protein
MLLGSSAATALEPVQPPFDLFETRPLSDAELAAIRWQGWQILHQERDRGSTSILLALRDGVAASELPGGRPRYLGRVREGERVVLVAPATPGEERGRTGRPVTILPSGAGVAITDEAVGRLTRRAHNVFRSASRSLPAPKPREAGPPARLRYALERAAAIRADMPGLRTADSVRAIVDAVNPDSLEKIVRKLSETTSGARESRWWNPGPPGDVSSIVAKSDYVRAKMLEALVPAGGAVWDHGFDMLDGADTVRVFNIVGCIPSGIPGAGAILLTAHLDATGARSDPRALFASGYRTGSACDSTALLTDPDCAWDPTIDPAPGGDDNATGIAAMLEAVRLLASKSFDFDLYFVAFQAEETGLDGSAAFADSVAQSGQEIFAVINMDMLGYNAASNELDVVTNETSEWLADYVIESGQQFVSALPSEKKVQFFGRSDHASFWSQGIDAILLIEDIQVLYPQYHSFLDTWETTFPITGRPNSVLQFELAAKVAVAALARLHIQHVAPDLALPPGEIEVQAVAGRDLIAGQTLRLTARVRNFGNSALTFADETTDSLTARVTFYLGDPARGGQSLGAVTHKDFFASGGFVEFAQLWNTTGTPAGSHEVFAVVEGLDAGYIQEEISSTNNVESFAFFLEAPATDAPRVLSHYVFPNPVRGSRDELSIRYELTRDADVTIEVFDLAGVRVGRFRASSDLIGEGNRAGANTIDASTFRWEGDDLGSGVYLYTIRTSASAGETQVRGKFALVR